MLIGLFYDPRMGLEQGKSGKLRANEKRANRKPLIWNCFITFDSFFKFCNFYYKVSFVQVLLVSVLR